MAEVLQQNPGPDVEKLLKKAMAGDSAAFGQVYDIYFQKVYRFVFYRVGHKEAAEDLVSETFVRAWARLSEINEIRAFRGWLYQIARNLVIDYYRGKQVMVDLEILENVLEYEDNLVDRANLAVEQDLFLLALAQLAPAQQTVIKLKFLEGLENDEIAKLLNKSEGAIRVIQHRAIQELKNILEKSRDR